MLELKANTSTNVPFFATNSAGAGVTGLAGFSTLASKNGGAFASTYVSCPEMVRGFYQAQLSAGVVNTVGILTLTLIDVSAAALRTNLQFRVVANLPDDVASTVAATHALASTAAVKASTAIIRASAALTAASGAGTLASAAWTAAVSARAAASAGNTNAAAAVSGTRDIQGRIPASLSSSGYMQSDIFAIVRDAPLAVTFKKGVKTMVRDSVASNGTTSTIPTDLAGAQDDFYKGLVVKFVSGTMAGQAAVVTGWNASSKVLTVSSLTSAPVAGASFIIA